MADLNDGLILYLPLTEPVTIDRSPLHHAVKVTGAPKLIADPLLGAATQFRKGDHLNFGGLSELKSLDQLFTLQMWLRRNTTAGQISIVMAGRNVAKPSILFVSQPDGACGLIDDGGSPVSYPNCLVTGQWTHLALVGDGKQVTVYENGALRKEGGAPVAASPFDCQLFAIPGDLAVFALAQVRLHNRALTAEEIDRQIIADMTLRTAYTETHPIVLSLLDADETATIYITDDPNGQPLTLEFFNAAQRPVFLDEIGSDPGLNSCHFELRFRPGALHKLSATPGPNQLKLVGTGDWAMSDPVAHADGTVSFYLLHRAQGKQPFDIESERTVRLKLTNVRADPATGARASRLELRYSHLRVGDPANAMVTGSRITYFSIANRIGRQNLPIHVGFIGGNTVLPGGIAGSLLRLRLVNISPDQPIPWQPGNPQNTEASFFKLTFDFEQDHEQRDWALARLNESKNITITAPRNDGGGRWIGTHTGVIEGLHDGQKAAYALQLEQPAAFTPKDNAQLVYQSPPAGSSPGALVTTNYLTWPSLLPNQIALAQSPPSPQKGSQLSLWPPLWQVTSAPQGETPSWTVWSEEVTDLQPDEFVELLIDGIVTSLPPGHTNLYVDYDNIPAYQSGRFVAILNKTPISFSQESNGTTSIELRAATNAATSEIYFTDPDHKHSGLGNVAGHAAIENAKDYDALMVLGRFDPAKTRRQLQLYDDVEIAGSLAGPRNPSNQRRELIVLEDMQILGKLTAGAMVAATSEIWFRDTQHNSAGSEILGDAALVNAKDVGALMIMGRSDSTGRRQLKMYNDVDIVGTLTTSKGGVHSFGVIRIEDDQWLQTGPWKIGNATFSRVIGGAFSQWSDLEVTHSNGNKFIFGEDGTLTINGKKVLVEP